MVFESNMTGGGGGGTVVSRQSPIDMESPKSKRKQSLLHSKGDKQDRNDTNRRRRRIGEVAGGATAECAVVCCCIPVALINLIILAVYKIPTGLGKKVWRKKKRKMLLNKQKKINEKDVKENRNGGNIDKSGSFGFYDNYVYDEDDGAIGGVDLEDEMMWHDVYGTGFWRMPSEKEDTYSQLKLD